MHSVSFYFQISWVASTNNYKMLLCFHFIIYFQDFRIFHKIMRQGDIFAIISEKTSNENKNINIAMPQLKLLIQGTISPPKTANSKCKSYN